MGTLKNINQDEGTEQVAQEGLWEGVILSKSMNEVK